MIFEALQSKLFRLNFRSPNSKTLKIPEFSLGMCDLIEGERVKVLKRIGGGHFGEVYCGELSGPRFDSNIHKMNPKLKESKKTAKCAIKKIKRQDNEYKEDEELRLWLFSFAV